MVSSIKSYRNRNVRRIAGLAALVLIISGCDYFDFSPFPEYIGNLEAEHDIGGWLEGLYDKDARVRFELKAVEAGGQNHLFLLLTPAVDDPTAPNAPQPSLLYLSEMGEIRGRLTVPDSIAAGGDFFSNPFGVVKDGTGSAEWILAGRILVNPSDVMNGSLYQTGSNSHSGYTAFVGDPSNTAILMSTTGGTNGSFKVHFEAFQITGTNWAPAGSTAPATVNIVNTQPSQEEIQNATEPIGYRLNGVIDQGDSKLLLFEFMPEAKLFLWSVSNQNLLDYTASPPSLNASIESLNPGKPTIDVTDGYVYYTDSYIIVRRTTGRVDRYDLSGNLLDTVVGEKGAGKAFAFTPDGSFMYRFNPELDTLQVIRTWW